MFFFPLFLNRMSEDFVEVSFSSDDVVEPMDMEEAQHMREEEEAQSKVTQKVTPLVLSTLAGPKLFSAVKMTDEQVAAKRREEKLKRIRDRRARKHGHPSRAWRDHLETRHKRGMYNSYIRDARKLEERHQWRIALKQYEKASLMTPPGSNPKLDRKLLYLQQKVT